LNFGMAVATGGKSPYDALRERRLTRWPRWVSLRSMVTRWASAPRAGSLESRRGALEPAGSALWLGEGADWAGRGPLGRVNSGKGFPRDGSQTEGTTAFWEALRPHSRATGAVGGCLRGRAPFGLDTGFLVFRHRRAQWWCK
jgi:hypothetical protein